MGIKGLTALISEHAPAAIQVLKFSRSPARLPRTALMTVHQEHKINTLFGRKVAIDASMSIYQFLIAVRQQDGQLLQNDAGEVTRYARTHLELGLSDGDPRW
jgi:flap endonuclease-1